MELRLKDKDNQLRMQWIRHKELANIIDGFRKIRKAERRKARERLPIGF